jgi:mannose-6-phosphate isomerase-like protein (cupin superfamily)
VYSGCCLLHCLETLFTGGIMNRREALGAISALTLMSSLAEAQTTATPSTEVKIFRYAEVPVTRGATGAAARNIPQDLIPAGDVTGVHLTTIDPGKEFGPMRKGALCEVRLLYSGKIEVMVEGMASQFAGPGDMIVAPAGATYHVRNPGEEPLSYFILQIRPAATHA